MSTEFNPRVNILMKRIENDYSRAVYELGWTISLAMAEDSHSYVVFSVCRDSISHRFGYLYSQ